MLIFAGQQIADGDAVGDYHVPPARCPTHLVYPCSREAWYFDGTRIRKHPEQPRWFTSLRASASYAP